MMTFYMRHFGNDYRIALDKPQTYTNLKYANY